MAKESKKRQLIRQRLASAKSEENLVDGCTDGEEYASGLDEALKALSW
ncbi:unnamed protein product [Lymnaea stagnalis]|uniref:Uncharacterized protein n=1 Tax=Lymnaea stagnalis TaxID=6523 RepID=A0AAV2HMT0_LYMST